MCTSPSYTIVPNKHHVSNPARLPTHPLALYLSLSLSVPSAISNLLLLPLSLSLSLSLRLAAPSFEASYSLASFEILRTRHGTYAWVVLWDDLLSSAVVGGSGNKGKEEEREEEEEEESRRKGRGNEERQRRLNEERGRERCTRERVEVGGTSHVAEFKREEESRGISRIRDVSGARVRSLREL